MIKSPLFYYLKRVANGDVLYTPRLCCELRERLLLVPTMSQGEDKGKIAVRVVRFEEQGHPIVPVFTSEGNYQEWCKEQRISDISTISLFGSDLCATVHSSTWLVIDPSTSHAVVLAPREVHTIATMLPPGGEQKVAMRRLGRVESSHQNKTGVQESQDDYVQVANGSPVSRSSLSGISRVMQSLPKMRRGLKML